MAKSPIPEVPDYGKIEPTKGFDKGKNLTPPDRSAFESYMEENLPLEKEMETSKISPEELKRLQIKGSPTQETITSQINETQNTINSTKTNFESANDLLTQRPDIPFKNQHKKILDNKLSQSFNHIQNAANALNANMIAPTKLQKGQGGPLAKFINYLNDGQNQMNEAQQKLEKIQSQKEPIKPSQMLSVQVNLSRAQQNIAFSSILLSQVITGLKQIFNIQV